MVNPFSLASQLQRGWVMVARDCGRFSYEPLSATHGRLTQTGFPPDLFESKSFALGFVGVLEGFFVYTKTLGTATLEAFDGPGGTASYIVERNDVDPE